MIIESLINGGLILASILAILNIYYGFKIMGLIGDTKK